MHCPRLVPAMPCLFQAEIIKSYLPLRREVNFHNANVNIGLPVFTIHGNHDDPSGDQNLSAVDVLSSCNLVNYFGRVVSPESWS